MSEQDAVSVADRATDVGLNARTQLGEEESHLRQLLQEEYDRAAPTNDWLRFKQFWWSTVLGYYDRLDVRRPVTVTLPLYKYGQDLSNRLMIAAGVVRRPDYRDDIKDLVKTYANRQDFCEATGLSEEQYRHVIHGRDDVSVSALVKALDKIGYVLKIEPVEKT